MSMIGTLKDNNKMKKNNEIGVNFFSLSSSYTRHCAKRTPMSQHTVSFLPKCYRWRGLNFEFYLQLRVQNTKGKIQKLELQKVNYLIRVPIGRKFIAIETCNPHWFFLKNVLVEGFSCIHMLICMYIQAMIM